MEAVLYRISPQTRVINLLSDAPSENPELSSYLLAALRHSFPAGSIFLAVIDPGVGGDRLPVVLSADGQFFVGPDNGLFNTTALHSDHSEWHQIIWRQVNCSASFHGRDLFAPVAANLANKSAEGMLSPVLPRDLSKWKADLAKIIYFDHYGNAMTGLSYDDAYAGKQLAVNATLAEQGDTFCSVKKGEVVWYCNSCGLVEIAVNQGNAREQLKLQLGEVIRFL